MSELQNTEFNSEATLPNLQHNNNILKVEDCSFINIEQLLNHYELILHLVKDKQVISGSYWGDSEAGLIKNTLYVRNDTPIHSLLHEACHYICMDNKRRQQLDTNAEGGYDEENAVCYLQILLANDLADMSSERMMLDMDSWGYTFRLGSAKAWFENDAEDALEWLQINYLLDSMNKPNYQLRA